jgi:hypothetical protein
VKSIEGDTPKPAAAAGEAAPARGVTHQIERDAQGRHVLRRKRFSMY